MKLITICAAVLISSIVFADEAAKKNVNEAEQFKKSELGKADPDEIQPKKVVRSRSPRYSRPLLYKRMQIGVWYGIPAKTDWSNVNGIKLGLPVSAGYGRVYGFECSVLSSSTDYIEGFQTGLITANGRMYGMQAGLVNYSEHASGFQFGLVNYSKKNGCQFGLINIIKNGAIPFFPIINVSF